jgi:hypothetical protein
MCFVRLKQVLFTLLACLIVPVAACADLTQDSPDKTLKIVIIRHGEKPESGDNLSCQGQNRALQLASVLHQKIGKPDYTYVPALKLDKTTAHSRMFQTITPFAVKYNLSINSRYEVSDFAALSSSALKKSGTVLMVWEHSAMRDLARALGIENPPKWKDTDFDSMWIVTYTNGKAELTIGQEGLSPSSSCGF